MDLKDFPDWHDVVKENWRKTTGYLLSFREPCIAIQEEELGAILNNRVLVGLEPAALADWKSRTSWFLAVILCPGDDIRVLVEWIGKHEADPDRIHFYAHPKTDAFEALTPWLDAHLPAPAVDTDIDSWRRLHKRFGNDLAVRILGDWS